MPESLPYSPYTREQVESQLAAGRPFVYYGRIVATRADLDAIDDSVFANPAGGTRPYPHVGPASPGAASDARIATIAQGIADAKAAETLAGIGPRVMPADLAAVDAKATAAMSAAAVADIEAKKPTPRLDALEAFQRAATTAIAGMDDDVTAASSAAEAARQAADAHAARRDNPHEVTKSDVGLGQVTNGAQVLRSEMGQPSGVATLGSDGKVPSGQLPAAPASDPAANVAGLRTLGTGATQAAAGNHAHAAATASAAGLMPAAAVTDLAALKAAGWQAAKVTTDANGLATFTYPQPFAAGVVPIVLPVAVGTGNQLVNAQLNGTPTNTAAVVRVNVMSPLLSVVGLNVVPFTAAPAGVVVHVAARAP